MNLEHEFTYVATLKPPVQKGAGPFVMYFFSEVTGGTVEVGGGDWLLIQRGWIRAPRRARPVPDRRRRLSLCALHRIASDEPDGR